MRVPLTHIALREDRVQPGVFPFTVPWLLPTLALELSAPVTFLVGENGTGKSTLLEAIAWSVGFGAQGGNRDQSYTEMVMDMRSGNCGPFRVACRIGQRQPFDSSSLQPGHRRRVATRFGL